MIFIQENVCKNVVCKMAAILLNPQCVNGWLRLQLSDEDREAILKLSLDDLIAKLQSRDLKAVDVLEAYQYAVRVR